MSVSSAATTPSRNRKLWETASRLDSAVERYTVGEDPTLDRRLLRYEVYGSLAHAAGLARIGVLSQRDHRALRKALARLLVRPEAFFITRAQEDIHTAVEQHLTRALGEAGMRIHAGRSRNDQVQTDLRLYLKDRLLGLHARTCEAAEAWRLFGARSARVLMPGYTHLQRAMPSTLGHWAASHAEAFLENARLLRCAFDEVDVCPLGSGAGYGVPLPLPRAYVARLLGFARVQRNTLRVQTSRPRLEAVVLSALAVLARDAGVLADDLRLFATAEFGFLRLPEAFTTGSSIMPQKRNPDVVELTRARACLFPGWLQQALSIGTLPSGYHRDYQLTKGPLMAAIETADEMLEILSRLPGPMKVDAARCRAALTEGLLATHKALALVREGVPFREAYRRVAEQARAGEAGARPAGRVDLPDYPGAPGDPGFKALGLERRREARWSLRGRRRLEKVFRRLLSGKGA
ncbi:MAG TPA: argininosuccinate lyase [Elusimicrobia bacterium]|nr:argininosuccinate lyase [Elusimicrobiota bacterium]